MSSATQEIREKQTVDQALGVIARAILYCSDPATAPSSMPWERAVYARCLAGGVDPALLQLFMLASEWSDDLVGWAMYVWVGAAWPAEEVTGPASRKEPRAREDVGQCVEQHFERLLAVYELLTHSHRGLMSLPVLARETGLSLEQLAEALSELLHPARTDVGPCVELRVEEGLVLGVAQENARKWLARY